MALTPRKDEVAAVVAILESDEHDDSVSMAKAIVRAVSEALSKRDAIGVAIGLKSDDLRNPFGPFWDSRSALKVKAEAESRGLVAFLAPLYAPDSALSIEAEATNKRCKCGHPKELHGSSITPKAVTTLGCCVYHRHTKAKCPCRGYEMER